MLRRSVPSRQLSIYFFRHFAVDCSLSFGHNCCWMYRPAIVHRENANCRNSHGQRAQMTMTIPDAEFSAVRFCSYAVRRTPYDGPSERQLRFNVRAPLVC